jgi:transcriptional regulator with PAS, ATPase and Fis domain
LRIAASGADSRRAAEDGAAPPDGLAGESAAMTEVRQLIRRYGPSDSPVLILGESGTGKELVARSVHAVSRRGGSPFVAVNCGALPESLIETELFGSEKGAFTDAVARPGCFERANGGTLFLDEIGELSAGAQTRLLRVLEQKELTRIGGTREVPLDVRVVSATNRGLKEAAGKGGFRLDLYYRLSVLPITVPPLRERTEDIPILAALFLSRAGGGALRFASDARDKLSAHPWPGNVRELRNVMERAMLAAESGVIRAGDVSFD